MQPLCVLAYMRGDVREFDAKEMSVALKKSALQMQVP